MMMGRAQLTTRRASQTAVSSLWDTSLVGDNGAYFNGGRDFGHSMVDNTLWTSTNGVSGRNSGCRMLSFELVPVSGETFVANQTLLGLVAAALTNSNCKSFLGVVPQSTGIRPNEVRANTPFSIVIGTPSPAWSVAVNDIIDVCANFDSGSIWWGKGGVWVGGVTPSTGTGGTSGRGASFPASSTLYPAASAYGLGNRIRLRTVSADLGTTPPSGFTAWD
jgi:hypothetical protein